MISNNQSLRKNGKTILNNKFNNAKGNRRQTPHVPPDKVFKIKMQQKLHNTTFRKPGNPLKTVQLYDPQTRNYQKSP